MRRYIAPLGVVLAVAAGCSSAPDPGPIFNNEGAQEVSCMAHQSDAPGARYTNKDLRNTGEILAVMRYYTSNGAKTYCDSAAPNDDDKAWGQVYVSLGGTAQKAATVLG